MKRRLIAPPSVTFTTGGRVLQAFADPGPGASTADINADDTALAQAVLGHLR